MAGETLLEANGVLASFPDNLAGLIGAVDSRSFLVSVATAVGFVEDDQAQVPYTIPMTDGVPVDFMGTLVAPQFFGNFWKLDGNNQFVPAYTDLGVTVPADTLRLIDGNVLLNCQKVGNATEVVYEFRGTEGGIFTGDPIQRSISNVPFLVASGGARIYDVSLAAPISFTITPIGHSEDLSINDVRLTLIGTML